MPKKSATARGGAQRGKAKAQKSFELVRPVLATHEQEQEQEQEPETQDVADMAIASTNTSNTAKASKASSIATVPAAKKVVPEVSEVSEEPIGDAVTSASAAPKASSASSRLAARRPATQQRPQRSAAPLVTAEHYAYVRKDLMFIAILAIIMFAAIIILHFTLG